jgi:hypothetical protein
MEKEDDLLELIPRERLSPEQLAAIPRLWRRPSEMPVYRLRQELRSLDEVNWKKYEKSLIWRDNGTLTCIGEDGLLRLDNKFIAFGISHGDRKSLEGAVYGENDTAMAETVTFFWSLKAPENKNARYRSHSLAIKESRDFKFSALPAKHLARIMDANPTRDFYFGAGVWTVKQARILASRPYQMEMTLAGNELERCSFAFRDGGKEFVNVLEKRQSAFGTLNIYFGKLGKAFKCDNLQRLLKLDVFGKLKLHSLDEKECAILPFSAQVNGLDYEVDAHLFEPEDFESVNIVAKDLNLRLILDNSNNFNEVVNSFLDRVAASGNVERLTLATHYIEFPSDAFPYREIDDLAPFTRSLVSAIINNPKLSCLDLSSMYWHMDWSPHVRAIFESLETHEGIRTLIISEYRYNDPNYSWLKQLLSRNRKITVLGDWNQRHSDGSSVDKLYALNHLYCGSAELKQDATSLRPFLVVTTLIEKASRNFQHISLLLADHSDILCEFLNDAEIEALDATSSVPDEFLSPATVPTESKQHGTFKRSSRTPSSRAAKRAARATM